MSLKEKFQVVLNQNGSFKCPNSVGMSTGSITVSKITSKMVPDEEMQFSLIVANLKQRGNSRPRTMKTLASTVSSLFPQGLPKGELDKLLHKLQSTGKVSVVENKLSYKL